MAFVRSIRKLGPISGVANVTLLAGFFGLLAFLLKGLRFNLKDVSYARLSTFPVFFGQLTGAYEGIGTVIPIESSMAENRPRFPLYLHITLAQVSFILGSFGVLGYMIYGSTVPQIVTDRLQTGVIAQLVRLTLIVAVMMTYPLQLYPVIEITESVLFTKVQSKKKSHLGEVVAGPSTDPSSNPASLTDSNGVDSPDVLSSSINSETQFLIPKEAEELQYETAAWKRNLLRTVLVTLTAGIAILLKDEFAYVNALIGSLGSSVLAYILPCTFHIILYKNTNSVAVVIKNIIIVVFGIVGGVVGVVITIQNIVKDLS